MSILDTIERLAKTAPVSTWALFGAGIIGSILQVGSVLVLWLGHWTPDMQKDQLMYIGVLAIMQAVSSLAVVASLSKTRVAAKGPGSFSIDLSADPSSQGPAVVTTTTTKTESP